MVVYTETPFGCSEVAET